MPSTRRVTRSTKALEPSPPPKAEQPATAASASASELPPPSASQPTSLSSASALPTDRTLTPLTYPYTPSERLVLTLEPYKSALLPHWRFATAAIARESSSELWERFLRYEAQDDFVGMDMARKFVQMGMTRAKRYANYKGGRKYAKGEGEEDGGNGKGKAKGEQLEKGLEHEGKQEKEEASQVFREVWERCKAWEGYTRRKEEWMERGREMRAEEKKRASEQKTIEAKVAKDEDGKAEQKPQRRHKKMTARRKAAPPGSEIYSFK